MKRAAQEIELFQEVSKGEKNMGFNWVTGVWKDTPSAPRGAGIGSEALRVEEQQNLTIADRMFWETQGERELAAERRQLEIAQQNTPADPTEAEINALETQINRLKCRRDYLEEKLRPLRLTLQSGRLSGTAVLQFEQSARELTGELAQIQGEISELSARHRELLVQKPPRPPASESDLGCCDIGGLYLFDRGGFSAPQCPLYTGPEAFSIGRPF